MTADNRAQLVSFLDPRLSLVAAPLKRGRDTLPRRQGQAASRLHFPSHVDRLLRAAGLTPLQRRTVGFGPFTLMGRPLLTEDRARWAHERLQSLADRGVPVARGTGWHYLVRAEKG